MQCLITSTVEESQTMEKEVDFTCYIDNNGVRVSELNFNQMVNRTGISLQKHFLLPPSTIVDGRGYALRCEAGYYNLGSRIDTFFDTFIADDDERLSLQSMHSIFDSKIIKVSLIFLGSMIIIGVLLFIILKRKKRGYIKDERQYDCQ